MAERDLFLAALIKKGFDGVNTKIDTMAGIATGGDVSWGILKKLVAAGSAKALYPVGTQFIVPHSKYGNLMIDVVAHDNHKNPNDANAPTMTLLMHHCIYGRPFDGFEAAYVVTAENYEDGLPAGTYHFLLPTNYAAEETVDGWTVFSSRQRKPFLLAGRLLFTDGRITFISRTSKSERMNLRLI